MTELARRGNVPKAHQVYDELRVLLIAGPIDDAAVADSPLVFPPASMQKRLRGYYDFKGIDDHQEWTSTFDPVIQS